MEEPFSPLPFGGTGCLTVISNSFALGARVSEEHHGANEFFRMIIGFAVVVFALGQFHRLQVPFSQVVDETRLGTSHLGDQGLQDPFMRLNAPFEIGRHRSRSRKSFHIYHDLLGTLQIDVGLLCLV